MPTKPKPEPSAPVPPETKKRAPRRKSAKPRGAAKSGAGAQSAATPASAELRSKAAVAKLHDAIDQLERALRSPVFAETESPGPQTEAVSVPLSPPPEREPAGGGWMPAVRPALAACVFLAVLGALAFGYSVGYSVRDGAVSDPMITVAAAAAEKPQPSLAEQPAERAPEPPAPAVEVEPSPAAQPAPPPPTAPGSLHLQVSALKSSQAAEKLGRKLESEGFPVQVRETGADGLVRVLVGPVEDREQLAAMADRLREEGLKPFPKRL